MYICIYIIIERIADHKDLSAGSHSQYTIIYIQNNTFLRIYKQTPQKRPPLAALVAAEQCRV